MNKFCLFVAPENFSDEMDHVTQTINMDYLYGKSYHFYFTSHNNRSDILAQSKKIQSSCFIGSKRIQNENCRHFKNITQFSKTFIRNINQFGIVFSFANLKRMQEIFEFMKGLDQLHKQELISSIRVFIYLDDIKEYFGTPEVQYMIYQFTELDIVNKVLGLSPTVPTNIIENCYMCPHNYLRNVGLDSVYPMSQEKVENYFSLSEHDFVFPPSYNLEWVDSAISAENFAMQVLRFFPQEFFSYGKKTFIPGNIEKSSHYEMVKNILTVCPFAVVVLYNQYDKMIYFTTEAPDLIHTIPLKTTSTNELTRKLTEFGIMNRPFFLTGYTHLLTCPEITSEEFGSFTGSIISHYSLHQKYQDKLYKLASKTTGHMKNWNTFQKTKIFCPPMVKDIVLSVEKYSFDTYYLSTLLYTQ
jgi:hypothetical protein